jgi:hypothetical protein
MAFSGIFVPNNVVLSGKIAPFSSEFFGTTKAWRTPIREWFRRTHRNTAKILWHSIATR